MLLGIDSAVGGEKMKIKKWLIGIFAALFAVCIALGIIMLPRSIQANADTVKLQGEGDAFSVGEKQYTEGEAFVYSATVNFDTANAAGLVFGAVEGERYWVFNVDRIENAVKLMYFNSTEGQTKVEVLKSEYYVGPSIMNDGEREYVASRTKDVKKVYLKVKINADKTAEFYADGIRRFAYVNGSEEAEQLSLDFTIEGTPVTYQGGALGYNCFSGKVEFTDTLVGTTDYAYYTEFYRNQYHFSQYAHWNNDPNGLVYYNGYYHLYFQHNPYGNTWDAMHWGHARSKDLVHWEELPIALVPDKDLDYATHGIGAMWSGSAMVYHKGDSDKIDNEYKWFGDVTDKADGEELGLIGFFSRFDNGGNRYQIVMYSDDGGLTWKKRDNIPCSVSKDLNGNTLTGGSWRDPKVFDISDIATDDYKWGMALTDMEDNTLFFLKSTNLVNWEHAGSYEMYRPECPDVVKLKADDNQTKTLITFTSRYYLVCDLAYEGGKIVMKGTDGNTITSLRQGDSNLKTMDYGVDSYAAQTFYIDADSDSAYAGKAVSMSWFSGVPNADASIESGVLQSARKVWNGGGMTIPVVYGLKNIGGEYRLTTTPITTDNVNFDKTAVSSIDKVNGHCYEIKATVENSTAQPVYFRVNESADKTHYTEIGWNSTDGYYVDRTHTEDAGIAFPQPNYALKYASGQGRDNTSLDFYILVDNNNVEVYCDGYTVPFYILTFASPYSAGASFHAEGEVTENITINQIGTVWRTVSDEVMINVSDTDIDIGTSLTTQKKVTAYADGQEISWSVEEGEDVAEVVPTADGAVIKAKKEGVAKIKASCGSSYRIVNVTVHSGQTDSDFTFGADGIIGGEWYYEGEYLVGEQPGGDGFILTEESGKNFVYTAQFDLGDGAAAAIVFRAAAEEGRLTSYLIANYDRYGKVVKLWSQNGGIASANVTVADEKAITLSVTAEDKSIKVYLNGNCVIDTVIGEGEPTEGRFGLNVCATKAKFNSITILQDEYAYTGSGKLIVKSNVEQAVISITNRTLSNSPVDLSFIAVDGRNIEIKSGYLELLPSTGVYIFTVSGTSLTFDVKVEVTAIPVTQLKTVAVRQGSDAVIYLGNNKVEYVKVNGESVESQNYSVKNYSLTIHSSVLTVGQNVIEIGEGKSVTVDVEELQTEYPSGNKDNNTAVNIPLIAGLCGGGAAVVIIATVVTLIVLKKRKALKNARSGDENSQEGE